MTKDGRPLLEPDIRETALAGGIFGVIAIGFVVLLAVVSALAIHPIVSVAVIMLAIGIREWWTKRRDAK